MKMPILVLAAVFASACAFADTRASRVDITSQPEGASVSVNGQDRGLTPLTLFDLKPGRHHVKFRLKDYVERDRYIEVTEGQVVQRSVVLEPLKGLLLVTSEPPGAAITVDGVAHGQTPRLFTELNAKDRYRFVLRKPGYGAQQLEVKFDGRTPVVRHEILVLDSGTVTVMSEPAGAFVTLNGVERGATPVTVSGIPKGRATIRLRKDGYRDEVREVAMNAGEQQQLTIALTGLPGTLSLSSVPAGARFYVNGEYRGKGEISLSGLEPRDYVIRCELEGYGTQQRTVTITNGATPREEFRLSNVKGRCEFRTSPAGVQVLVDGRPVGVTRSSDESSEFSDILPVENLLEGEHVVVFRKDGYSDQTFHPRVVNSKTYQKIVRLRRVFKPDVEITTDSGTYRGVLVSKTPEYVTIEIKLGVQKIIPRIDVRKMTFLDRVP